MKATLLAAWAKVQPLLAKVYAWSPLACGIALGYFGKPIIKLAIDLGSKLIKALLG